MTTKLQYQMLPYQREGELDYAKLCFDPFDPDPLPDAMIQNPILRVDPTGGDLYWEPLAGERLIEGAYDPVELTTAPDGVLKGYSPTLALSLCWYDEWLYLYDPATGQYLMNIHQAMEAYEAERAAREAAEARIRQLEAELRRRQSGN